MALEEPSVNVVAMSVIPQAGRLKQKAHHKYMPVWDTQ